MRSKSRLVRSKLAIVLTFVAAMFALTLTSTGTANASTEYRVPATNSINLTPYDEPTATYVEQMVINSATQHSVVAVYIGDLVTTNTGTQYYLQGGVVRAQYWNGSKFVSYYGWDFGDCGFQCYGWYTRAASSWRPGAIYIAFDLTLGSGLGHTTGRYKL